VPDQPAAWVIDTTKTREDRLEIADPEGWWSAIVKWDGCIDLRRYINRSLHEPDRKPDDVDDLHICELDELIRRLEALRERARQHFGEGWPDGEGA